MLDLEASLAFWQAFLGVEPRWRATLDRPYLLGEHVGYPGVPSTRPSSGPAQGAASLELLDYRDVAKAAVDERSANPGHVHS